MKYLYGRLPNYIVITIVRSLYGNCQFYRPLMKPPHIYPYKLHKAQTLKRDKLQKRLG